MIVYALDIGGSSLKHALIRVSEKHADIIKRFESVIFRSNTFSDLLEVVKTSVGMILKNENSLNTVAVSTTGAVGKDGIVINAGHFKNYTNISWELILKQEFKQITKVVTANDGKASAWAEYIGQGGGAAVFVHFVVGTGIGGGIVFNGELIFGDGGYAGYLGHIKVTDETQTVCSCKRYGCVETVASAPAIVRFFEAKDGQKTSGTSMTLSDVVTSANAGNKIAVEAFKTAGTWLGIAMSTVMNILNPGVITIGGGVPLAAAGIDGQKDCDVFVTAAIERARELAHRRVAAATKICPAKYGNDGGMVGAALMTYDAPRL